MNLKTLTPVFLVKKYLALRSIFPLFIITLLFISGCVGKDELNTDREKQPATKPCIPSGDQDSINNVLTGPGSAVALCKNAVFELTKSLVFSHENQTIYTEGFPRDDSRALIKIADENLIVAVNALYQPGARLRNVIVDGGRGRLGRAKKGEGALLRFGGYGDSGYLVRGQVVEFVKAYEPRGWSTLVIDGSQDTLDVGCSEALISDNEFGPAGHSDDGTWADGISLACANSVVSNNLIIDATDGGIVIFGAPGSLITNNTIRAETRLTLGGIVMVDYAYHGDYTNTRVIGNTIDARGAPIRIGLAMGARAWGGCLDPDSPENRLRNRGGIARENVLTGKHMMYGFLIDGVENWTALDNRDEATHSGTPTRKCGEQVAAHPSGFQMNGATSSGRFQDEFQEAVVDGALVAIYSPNNYWWDD